MKIKDLKGILFSVSITSVVAIAVLLFVLLVLVGITLPFAASAIVIFGNL